MFLRGGRAHAFINLARARESSEHLVAMRVAGELAGIKGEPQVITQRHRATFAEMLGLSKLSLFSSLQPFIPGSGTALSYKAW